MKHTNLHLMWFRQDLRLLDNTALSKCCEHALAHHAPVLAIYYLTPIQWQQHNTSLWQIDLILRQLNWLKQALAQLNIGLIIRTVADFTAQSEDLLTLCQLHNIRHVFANREYLVNEIGRDNKFKSKASENKAFESKANHYDIQTHWFDDRYLIPPKTIVNHSGNAYKVFTPFYKRWLALLETMGVTILESPYPQKTSTIDISKTLTHHTGILTLTKWYRQSYSNDLTDFDKANVISRLVDKINLLELIKEKGEQYYPSGEAVEARLADFLAEDISHYGVARDVPAYHDTLSQGVKGATSHLSAYLALGMISPRLCYQKAMACFENDSNVSKTAEADISLSDTLQWLRQLTWRDFYGDIVVNYPNIVKGKAFLHELDKAVVWRYDIADFTKWCQGKTGVPLVDSAMRCLNATGFMHNRLRMVVAMYLTKNLLIDWRWGERYFMQCLVDGDFANNNGGWQWSASIGTDAQPYFRVMNPFSQALNYDSQATFIKQWLPCLSVIPPAIIHNEAKLQTYLKAHPTIDYPQLTTPTKTSRANAIAIFKQAKFHDEY